MNEFTLQDGMHASFRYALDRQIVGEVRGREVAQMIMAMESGSGSLSTTHAASASDTMEKLVSCAMQSGEFTRDSAVMKLARCLGLVVQLRSMYVRGRDGSVRKRRVVDEHPVVFSWEARPGSGERGPDGRPVNEFTLQDGMHASFRYALDRQIVGEVRGREVAQMIMAMESGSGSLSTTHAASASDTMEKLVSCAMQSGEFTRDSAVMKLARCLGLVVQLRSMFVRGRDGSVRKRRVVDEVLAITPGEESAGYAATTVFRSDPDGPAVAFVLPDHLRMLTTHGFTANEFLLEAQRHGGVA